MGPPEGSASPERSDVDGSSDGESSQRSSSASAWPTGSDDQDTCAVCYNVCCHPARISEECSHVFCRLCVFKCRLWEAGCPMCRAPISATLQRVKLPSQIAYEEGLDAAIAKQSADAYQEALEKERSLEARLKATLQSVPIVTHPGQLPRDDTGRLRVPRFTQKTTFDLIVSDPSVQQALKDAERTRSSVGFVFSDTADATDHTKIGYVAQVLKILTPRCSPRGSHQQKVRVAPVRKFKLDERDLSHTEHGGLVEGLVALVELQP